MEIFRKGTPPGLKLAHKKSLDGMDTRDGKGCIDEETLISYSSQTLEEQEVGRVEDHLAICSRCREAIIVLNRMLNSNQKDESLPDPSRQLEERVINLCSANRRKPLKQSLQNPLEQAAIWLKNLLFYPRLIPLAVLATAAAGLIVISLVAVRKHSTEFAGNYDETALTASIVVRPDSGEDEAYGFAKGAPTALTGEVVITEEHGGSLRPGDRFQIRFKTTQGCCIYVFHSNREISLVFPTQTAANDFKIEIGREYVLPSGKEWFTADETPGKETFYFLSTSNPIQQSEPIARDIQSHPKERIREQLGSNLISFKVLSFNRILDNSVKNKQ